MEFKKNHKPLILASKSPRRLELLNSAGIYPKVIESRFSEPEYDGQNPEDFAKMLAYFKALDVVNTRTNYYVLGADTIVVFKNKILLKPKSDEEAKDMLTMLSGNTHEVITGFSLISPQAEKITTLASKTKVSFRRLSFDEISWYISTKEPFDKAGGYGIQSKAASFATSIEGSYTNVVGLPLSQVIELMERERIIE
ncbi:MAG: septum formation protein Maf [Desulfobacteraceae bacterium]|nr:septum formation protein Maf [Desulfobacteraceae bacterium]